jgi:glycosyltransferase involved in cell wall biosynthesis
MQNATVAIITRTKNRNILLKRAVESVLGQTYTNWVHVIVNDGGQIMEIENLLSPYKSVYKGRVVTIHNPVSLGMEAASNVGLRSVNKSKYAIIHDDDDTWEPLFLEKCVAFMENPPPVLGTPIMGVATYCARVLEKFDGSSVRIIGRESFNSWLNGVSLYRLAASNTLPPICFLFQRDALEKIGYFREDLPVLGDWEFHLRFAYHYEIGLIREELANYHHRVSLQNDVYGNSVIAGDDKHRRYEHLLRNELLRNDIKDGKAGLGFLLNIVNSFEVIHSQLSPVLYFVNILSNIKIVNWLYRKFRYNKKSDKIT